MPSRQFDPNAPHAVAIPAEPEQSLLIIEPSPSLAAQTSVVAALEVVRSSSAVSVQPIETEEFETNSSDEEDSSSDEGLEPPTPRPAPAHIAALMRSSAAQVWFVSFTQFILANLPTVTCLIDLPYFR